MSSEAVPGCPPRQIPMSHLREIVVDGVVALPTAYFRGICNNLSKSCKRHLPWSDNSICISLSSKYAFHLDVSPMLDAASDIEGAIVVT